MSGRTRALSIAWSAVILTGALAITDVGCSAPSDDDSADQESGVEAAGKIQLLVTVDWEGLDLREENLRAMRDLHARFPRVKIVHFLNAAYFLKVDANAADVRARIASAIAPGDENGLHIHAWKRLFEAAGVTFRSSPTVFGNTIAPEQCAYDCGHEVPISLYSAAELRKVVRFSVDKLAEQGFGGIKSFRSGAWLAEDWVREAIAAEGLVYDQSAVPPILLAPHLRSFPLQGWLEKLWRGTTLTAQPYRLPTRAGELVEIPDNGALADYVSADQMVETFEANKAEYLRDPEKDVVVSIGFHQESAVEFLPALEEALERIYETAAREQIPLESVITPAITSAR